MVASLTWQPGAIASLLREYGDRSGWTSNGLLHDNAGFEMAARVDVWATLKSRR